MEDVMVWAGIVGFCALVWWMARLQNEQANEGVEKLVCPHCQERGHITARAVVRGKGVSGGKATAGLMTGGLSLPFAGLSKNQHARELSCSNCGSKWDQ